VGGPSNREGRVEMCYRGVWGAISDLDWNNQDAAVTCHQDAIIIYLWAIHFSLH